MLTFYIMKNEEMSIKCIISVDFKAIILGHREQI